MDQRAILQLKSSTVCKGGWALEGKTGNLFQMLPPKTSSAKVYTWKSCLLWPVFLYWTPVDLLCLHPSWTDQDVMALNLSVTVDEACTVTLDPTCTLCHK